MNTNGFRQTPQASRKQKLQAVEKEAQNLNMAVRLNQMMTQQLLQSFQNMKSDLGNALNLINELQYKILAVQRVANLDVTEMNKVAQEMRLKDFNEASEKENLEKGYTAGTTVNEDSIVVITSTTNTAEDQGIFRSKLPITQSGVPELFEAFKGQAAGHKAVVKLNDVEHTIELIAVYQPPVAPAPEATETPAATEAETH